MESDGEELEEGPLEEQELEEEENPQSEKAILAKNLKTVRMSNKYKRFGQAFFGESEEKSSGSQEETGHASKKRCI